MTTQNFQTIREQVMLSCAPQGGGVSNVVNVTSFHGRITATLENKKIKWTLNGLPISEPEVARIIDDEFASRQWY